MRNDTRHSDMVGTQEFTPLADARNWVLSYGMRHPKLVTLGSAVAVVVMGLLVAWFVFLSNFGVSSPGLVYAGF